MKKRKGFVVMALLLAVLLLGIGYAAIAGVTLTINGKATATPNSTFVVKFDQEGTITKGNYVVADTTVIDDDITATLNVEGMTAKGQTATATFPITSEMEADIQAALKATVTNENEEYFNVTAELANDTLTATTTDTTVTVTVELIKTPIGEADITGEFTVTIDATPDQVEVAG